MQSDLEVLLKLAYSTDFVSLLIEFTFLRSLLGSHSSFMRDGGSKDFLVKFKYMLSKLTGEMFFSTAA